MRSDRDTRMIEIAGEIRGETPGAWKFFDGAIVVLLPKSLLKGVDMATLEVGAAGSFEIPEWLAKDRELI
jgi:hypothetical protein